MALLRGHRICPRSIRMQILSHGVATASAQREAAATGASAMAAIAGIGVNIDLDVVCSVEVIWIEKLGFVLWLCSVLSMLQPW